MSFDIVPPKRKSRPNVVTKPAAQPRGDVPSRPQKPTPPPVITTKTAEQPKPVSHVATKNTSSKKQKSKHRSQRNLARGFGRFFLVLILLGGFGGFGWMIMTGKITLPDAQKTTSPTNRDTVSPGIITRFEDEELPDFEEDTPQPTESVAQDPLMAAQADFAAYIQTVPSEPAPAGFDGREYQLLEKYINDFAF